MNQERQLNQFGLFIPLRLASYVIIMALVVFWVQYPSYLYFPTLSYSLLTLLLGLLIAFEHRLRLRSVAHVIVAIQFLLEIVVESGIIFATGNVQSSFSALYVLTIVSAAMAYRLVGTLIIASIVSAAYVFIVWLGMGSGIEMGLSIDTLRTVLTGEGSVFYSIFLHILIFYLVAFISGYLAERLFSQSETLVHASRQLQRARLETDDILRHLNSGLLTIDPFGCIIYFNRAAERILSYRESQVRGMFCGDVFAERMPVLGGLLSQAITHGITYPRKEIEAVDQSGATIPLGVSTSLLTKSDGTVRGVIAIFSDLTEAKRLEAKVRAADRLAAVGELSASIAHEIRNPLAAISGSVEVLKSELPLEAENARLMGVIIKESGRLNRILSDFLTYARVDRPTYTRVELCHVIGDVIELVRHHDAFRKSIEISLTAPEPIVYVIGDEDLFRQLLLNLAINSCEAMANEGGVLIFELIVCLDKNIVELRVSDTGPGMVEEVREKIFQPFYSTKRKGTGLGLAIVHRICTTLGVGIQVESTLDTGTSFILRIPKTAAGQLQTDPAQHSTPSLAPKP